MFKLTSSYVSSYTLPSFHHITEGAGEPGDELLSEHYFPILQLSYSHFRKSWKSGLSPSQLASKPNYYFHIFLFHFFHKLKNMIIFKNVPPPETSQVTTRVSPTW